MSNAALSNTLRSLAPEELEQLRRAFARFREASKHLEQKYDELREESQRLRTEIERKDQMIRKQERLASLGEMAALVAHEVRNPLGAMKLFVSLLAEEVSNNNLASEYAENISKSLNSLERIVAHILEFSSSKSLVFAPLNIHAVIQECLSTISNEFTDQLQITSELDAHAFIVGNEQSLRQVVSNLLRNAAQAVNGCGCIAIRTKDIDSSQIEIIVSDNGPGIPSDVAARIFEPFVTTKHQGTGLGLALVQRSVLAHSGSIKLEQSQGARFVIVLPRCQPTNSIHDIRKI